MEKSNKDKSYSKINNNNSLQQPKIEKSSLEKKSNRKRKPDSERDKQKAELERSGNELKHLINQFGTKAKVADEIDRDTTALRDSIYELMTKARSKSINKVKHDAAPHHRQLESSTFPTSLVSSFSIIWNNLLSLIAFIIHPFQMLYQSYEKLYHSINCNLLLISVLLLELSIIGLIWKFKRIQYIHMYEPYEPVVHGTYGVEKTSWVFVKSLVDILFDFFSEMKHGGRSFTSSNYDDLVPI